MLRRLFVALGILATAVALFPGAQPEEGDVRHLYPTTLLALGLDTDAHTLPYLLGFLENIDYPKKQISLEIYVHSKEDTTQQQVGWWLDSAREYFRRVKLVADSTNWLEDALRSARVQKISRCFLLPGDTVPKAPNILQMLFREPSHLVVTPLFQSVDGSLNVEEASERVQKRENVREQVLKKVWLPLAINLTAIDSSYLTFDAQNLPHYEAADEPLEVFANSAERMDIPIYVDNQDDYGFFVNPELDLEDRRTMFRYQLADVIADGNPLPIVSRSVRPWLPEPSLWDTQKIYVINLKRRPERLQKMEKIFELLGVEATVWEATDGNYLDSLPSPHKSHATLPSYRDPIMNRPIKAGEIGCFLSHYRIWEDVVKEGLDRVIVFEDDLRFAPNGLQRVREVLADLDATGKPWDLIYLGRKKQADQEELWVSGHRHLSTVGYSYWTLGYLLSKSGAEKLLAAKPLQKIVPVDEFLPIMFDRHPNQDWKEQFQKRDLDAFTLYPLSVSPQRYTHENGYVSDTENSSILQPLVPSKGKTEL
ncbi:unnamed protein product [Caenorhabditis auriculariae]|uniref:Glycosyl transferase family 25 domain-containing protein n=1 Tax=Caenorhabditis auriculariae TaxID=2777116 RepID=A0A8S1GZJ7_9PELO|nr:unnamed protein product [Caenorhabditis auriculariae]